MHLTFKKIIFFFFISVTANCLTGCSDNAKLQPLGKNSTILAFGDSLTYGTGTSREKAYPAVLQTLIQRKVINAGVPGEITEKGLLRLPGLIRQYQPDLIIICHGANDIIRKLDISQAKHNIQQMIDLAKQNNSQVLLIAVPEFSLFLNTSPIYQVLAENNQLPIENNILSEIIANNSLKSDHVHPNAHGYQLLAESIDLLLKQSAALPN
jgi:lysophospholipase L1-like esterase